MRFVDRGAVRELFDMTPSGATSAVAWSANAQNRSSFTLCASHCSAFASFAFCGRDQNGQLRIATRLFETTQHCVLAVDSPAARDQALEPHSTLVEQRCTISGVS
jgi:hypothetical protein